MLALAAPIQYLLDLLLPPCCLGCNNIISQHHTFCGHCWKKCNFLAPPWCALCGYPFPYETSPIPDDFTGILDPRWGGIFDSILTPRVGSSEGEIGDEKTASDRWPKTGKIIGNGYNPFICLSCSHQPPLFAQCRSALAYDEGSRPFILKLKHADSTYLAKGLSQLMVRAGTDIFPHTDLLIPVPLHWKRLFWRQYNQAILLTHHIAQQTRIPMRSDLIRRHRSTPPQGKRNRQERYANVRGAFSIRDQKTPFIKGKRLTLIDDVFTTGSTLNECARILLQAGAKEIRILTLARVITPL